MRIRGDELKKLANERGLSVEQLAGAVSRMKADDAASAIRNWMVGRDHPRCKASDIAALANALQVQPREIAKYTSSVMYHRGSGRKVKLVTDLVRGKSIVDAENLLTFTTKRAALNVRKALKAAIAEADNSGADLGALYVSESRVDEAPVMKRFQPKDRGRAHQILKRFSHITISVQERGETADAGSKSRKGGKGR